MYSLRGLGFKGLGLKDLGFAISNYLLAVVCSWPAQILREGSTKDCALTSI